GAGKAAGLYTVGALVCSLSPVHTNQLFADKTRGLVALGVDAILLKDSAGLLTPERVKTLLPAMQAALGGRPLEIHSHCTTGLAPIVYAEALRLGVAAVHPATSPLANGRSLPPTERIVDFARRLGRRVTVDDQGLATMAVYFRDAARAAGKPLGRPVEYDPFHYRHQVPGGMMTNLRAQLVEAGLVSRLDEILEEIARVREELGWLNMVTPTAQVRPTPAGPTMAQGAR